MIPKYVFLINNGSGQIVSNPVWKDDLSLDWSYESNQMFKRAQLSGDLTFVGMDYDYIMQTAFDHAIAVEVQVSYESSIYQILFEGEFYLTDCTVNVDDRSVKVKPKTKDKYTKILAGLEKEYDLIKLCPAIQPVTTIRRPMLQVYVGGEDTVTCILSGMSWEQEITKEGDPYYNLIEYCHFGLSGVSMEMDFSQSSPSYMRNQFVGIIPSDMSSQQETPFMENGQGCYISWFWYDSDNRGYRVRDKQNPTNILWECNIGDGDTPETLTFVSQRAGIGNITATWVQSWIFARWCLATTSLNGNATYPIADDDVVPYNRNYKYCYPFSNSDNITMSFRSSNDPTEWGLRPDGQYYLEPAMPTTGVIRYLPIGRSRWEYGSIWFVETQLTDTLERYGRKDTQLRDAFTLEAVITALLAEIDPEITFMDSQVYSRFLFGTNPLMTVGWGRLVMTPKSNVLVAEYTQPARKAPITLGQVLNMLRDVCGCYWYLNDSKQLIVEHVSWFKNGGSYSGTQAIGIDITVAENIRNGKMLSFGTNEYSFDKMEMPERYEYAWMDDTTDTFKGQAIDVLSGYVEEGKIEEITVDGFNADLDYMMLNPSNISEDGFALLCCKVTNGIYATEIDSAHVQSNKVQNWQLCMEVLQPAFLISDMPAWSIKVNGSAGTAKGIQRKKEQKVNIPVGYIEPNMQQLIKTGLGTGEIKEMQIVLTSRTAKTTISYDTTQQ